MNIDNVRMLSFRENGDERGKLVVVESNSDIPIEIKRVFYIYGSDKETVRGCHANRNTEFVLINISGTSKVRVRDREREKIYVLDKPHTGIYIPQMIWKDMYDFSDDSILLCLASEHYDPAEYIRDFNEFLEEAEK